MQIACPNCGKALSVAEDFGGRRVKCPGCEGVFRVPPSTSITPTTAVKAAPTAMSNRPVPPKTKVSPPPLPAKRGAEEDDVGRCYINIRKDDVKLNEEVEERLEKLIETEQLEMRIMHPDDEPPAELAPNDLVISGKVTEWDYGSQFMRYMFTFVTIFGPGASVLKAVAKVETAEGEPLHIKASARIGMGVFGGSDKGLMKRNVQTVGQRIAREAIRHFTGTSFLNAQVYSCANWSLGLGLASLIPVAGFILGPIGLVLSLVALMTIGKRELPRGKGVAIAGLVSSLCGLAISLGVVVLGLRK